MPTTNWYTRIQKELAGDGEDNSVLRLGDEMPDPRKVIYKPTSRSLQWAMDGGLPGGKVLMLAGPESGGKSAEGYDLIQSMQNQDPEGWAILYDAEYNYDKNYVKRLGVDTRRLIVKQGNSAKGVFDHFHKEVMPLVQDGLPLRMMMIDSVKALRGPREAAMESTEDNIMADLARVLGPATKMIVGDIRQHSIATVLIQQVNEEMDPNIAKYQSKWKIPNGQALKHFIDILVLVERVNAKDSKIFDGHEVQLGHTIRATVRKNRVGAPFRVAEYQLAYGKGVTNVHKEVAGLAVKLEAVERPNQQTYKFGDRSFRGRDAFEQALASDVGLQEAIMAKIMKVYVDPEPAAVMDDLIDSTAIAEEELPPGMDLDEDP